MFEHTSKEIINQYKNNNRIDFDGLCKLPTIFMTEGTGDEVASVGRLLRVSHHNGDYNLNFIYDDQIPRFTNADIFSLSSELNIANFEFSRNHWAVKDVDLFQVLYRRLISRPVAPKVFKLSTSPVDPSLVTMMMPFSGNFNNVYRTVRQRLESEGYKCNRADDFWMHHHIMQDIVELIWTSQVVVCDLSGKNPNVFYEAGIAHTWGKEVILITQHIDDVPFDLRQLRCITYHDNDEGRQKLATDIVKRLRTIA